MEVVIDKSVEFFTDFWAVLIEMSPYLLFGFFVAGVLSVFLSPQWVERHLGAGKMGSVLKASAIGVPLPLCSCGVIPVSASLRRHGASKSATTSFLISTPQTGVDSILITYSLLGPFYAVYRPVAALVSGVIGGFLVSIGTKPDEPAEAPPGRSEHKPQSGRCESDSCEETSPEGCHAECCSENGHGKAVKALRYGFLTLPEDIAGSLIIGLFIAAAISALLPEGYFSNLVPPGPLQILILMLAGIPIYVCATASVPVAAALIIAGVSPGAAFAFLMTGPATNAATIATIFRVMGRRTALIYVGTMAVAAFAGGLLLDYFFGVLAVPDPMSHAHGGWMPVWFKTMAAVVLLALLAYALLHRYVLPRLSTTEPVSDPDQILTHGATETQEVTAGPATADARRIVLNVKGMTCNHCKNAVTRALAEQPGVQKVNVELSKGVATILSRGSGPEDLAAAVRELGYESEPAEQS